MNRATAIISGTPPSTAPADADRDADGEPLEDAGAAAELRQLALPAELNYLNHTYTCAPAPVYDAGARQMGYAGQPASGAACQIEVMTQVATDQVRTLAVTAMVSKNGGPAQPLTASVLLNPFRAWLPLVSR